MISRLLIRNQCMHEMIAHASRHAPLEACGLLAGSDNQVEKVIGVRNQAQSPVRFVMDPHEQLQAFDWIESNGFDLLGIFHSHPAGPEIASVTDITEAAYQVVHLILSRTGGRWKTRGFWIADGKSTEVTLQIID
jgi:[CysO sulfur-carrier protein]-S-L-cysteine hydrolase